MISAVFAALAARRSPACEKEVILTGRDEFPMPQLTPSPQQARDYERTPFRGTLPRNKYALTRVLGRKNRGRD